MVKVKKSSLSSKVLTNSSKKSNGVLQSIKSPKLRRKSISSILPTPLKPKQIKDERKSVSELENNNQDVKIDIKPKKSKLKATENRTYKNVDFQTFEDKFNIKINDVESAIEGVIKLHSENPKVKNQLFDGESFSLSVMINCHNIPTGNQRILRIPLTNTLLTPEDDICLIVSEVKGIGNKEIEKHVDHYEKLLTEKGVTYIKKIMTVHELKTEYETFEQKARLVDLYDRFLVCGKVCGKVVKKCGKIFYKKRKVPTSVKLQASKLKEHIDKQLSKAFLHLHLKGDSYFVEFGFSYMEVPKLVENFVSVIEFLEKEFPGGFNNIKGLHINAPRATSIPVYISTKNSAEISKVKVKRQNKFVPKAVKGELTTQLNTEVLVKPSGQVVILRETTKVGNKRIKTELQDKSNDAKNTEGEEIPRKKIKHNKNKLESLGDGTPTKENHSIKKNKITETVSSEITIKSKPKKEVSKEKGNKVIQKSTSSLDNGKTKKEKKIKIKR